MKPTLLVLAAGIGSRYGGLKQLDPVGPAGEIIIDYSVFDAIRAGFGKVVFIIRKEIEDAFREGISGKYEGRLEVQYAYQDLQNLPPPYRTPVERKKPWGTGHAILAAADGIGEPFAAINADDFYGYSSFAALATHLTSARRDDAVADFCMAGFILRNTLSEHGTVARGVCQGDEKDYLCSVTELTKIAKRGDGAVNLDQAGPAAELSGDEIVSMNMWGFTPVIFTHLRTQLADFLAQHLHEPKAEFFIPSVVDRLIRAGRAKVKILKTADPWFGITYQADKPKVVDSIKKLVADWFYRSRLF